MYVYIKKCIYVDCMHVHVCKYIHIHGVVYVHIIKSNDVTLAIQLPVLLVVQPVIKLTSVSPHQ